MKPLQKSKTSESVSLSVVNTDGIFVLYKVAVWFAIILLSIFYANAVTMRKQLFGISRVKGMKPKDFVKEKLDAMYDMTQWTILNRNGVPDKKMEDIYDAVVVACYEPNP